MKKLHVAVASMLIGLGFAQMSAAASDVGVIGEVVTKLDGVVGFTLVTGAPNAQSMNSCVSGWVGLNNPNDPGYKNVLATILSAKASGSTVEVVTVGCLYNGVWNKLVEIYIK